MIPPVSITVMPHIQDGEDGWYAVIGGEEVWGPGTEEEAAVALQRTLDS